MSPNYVAKLLVTIRIRIPHLIQYACADHERQGDEVGEEEKLRD